MCMYVLCLYYFLFFALVAPVTKTNSLCMQTHLAMKRYLILITVQRFFAVMSEFGFSSLASYDLSEFILIFWFAAKETFILLSQLKIVLNEVWKPLGLYSDMIPWLWLIMVSWYGS